MSASVVSVFNTLRKKELHVAPGQECVVLAEKVVKLGYWLQRGKNIRNCLAFLVLDKSSSSFLFISYKPL